jgi:hypothetical protein
VSFTVTARHQSRDVSFQRGSMLAALEQALTLASAGMEGVLVRDGSGRSRTPVELSRELLAGAPDRDTSASQPRAA